MTVTPNYLSQRQFLVEVDHDSITGYWMQKSGGNSSADSNKIYAGGDKTPYIVTGITDVENVTISRAYDAARDGQMLQDIRGQVGSLTTEIKVSECTVDYEPISGGVGSIVYSKCVLVGISEPEFESSSGDAAAIQLEFAVQGIAPAPKN